MGRAIILSGPTASGKTEVAAYIYEYLSEYVYLVSCDSRQVYKYMNIGTAKPDKEFLKRYPHYMIDVVEPSYLFTTGDYMHGIKNILKKEKNRIPIFVGGTSFYIRNILNGFIFEDYKDFSLRKRLDNISNNKGNVYLYNILKRLDPERAKELHPNDLYRVKRAIEIRIVSGLTYKDFCKKRERLFDKVLFIGLYVDRKDLYKRIDDRVDSMIDMGLVEEVEFLVSRYGEDIKPLKTIGYYEIIMYLKGLWSFEKSVYEIKKKSRHLAKEQILWLKNTTGVEWFPFREKNRILERIKKFIFRGEYYGY